VFGERLGIVGNLYRQLPGRREDENAWLFLSLGSVWIHRMGQYALQCGDQECGSLAGSCLRLAGHIALFQCKRQGIGLNRCTEFETHILDAGVEAFFKLQSVESEVAQMVISH